jgi:hypothetical protein
MASGAATPATTMEFRNTTALSSDRLHALFVDHTQPYAHDRLHVVVRYSRGADFSGMCRYRDARISINLGRHVEFPYALGTHIARARSNRTCWWRETYRLTVASAYQLVLFVYLHELYHYLVKQSGHSPRQKESRCDRFATRALINSFGCPVTDRHGQPVPRSRWDFQDLDAFVERAPQAAPVPGARLPQRLRGVPVKVW